MDEKKRPSGMEPLRGRSEGGAADQGVQSDTNGWGRLRRVGSVQWERADGDHDQKVEIAVIRINTAQ